jgi:hypothetical protein
MRFLQSHRQRQRAGFLSSQSRREGSACRYPDKWVGLLSYAYHSEPPRFRIEPGVYVQVTTGFRYTSLTFEQQVRRLRELGADVGVYD